MPFFRACVLGGYELFSVEFGRTSTGHDEEEKPGAGSGGSIELGYTGVRDDEVVARVDPIDECAHRMGVALRRGRRGGGDDDGFGFVGAPVR